MTRRIYVPLAAEIHEALLRLARSERRTAQDEAALIITEALARSGFLDVVRAPEKPAR